MFDKGFHDALEGLYVLHRFSIHANIIGIVMCVFKLPVAVNSPLPGLE